ncbi:unnamed protein product [Callosobruchus maculatus]|uniref:Nucleotide exchange factor SIL1 n=1 Tax=Callosobruchus maculatus TaxID=64391 RepID=A0A653C181_CALMS|nr:unnamed protein product [Callosobruchus maculatus]
MRINVPIYLIIFCISVNGQATKEEENEEFIPTKDWKIIKEGQKVPEGLHYRINLETGIKEAKLLDDGTEQRQSERTHALLEIPNEDQNDELLHTDVIKQVIKKIKNDDVKKTEKNAKKFRSYEQLKTDFKELNMVPKMDIEILIDLMKQHKDELSKEEIDTSSIVRILEDFDFLAHQIDNGVEFIKQNGLQEIIYKNLNSTSDEVKEETLKLFGSLLQNNPKVQISALESGAITVLLRTLATEQSGKVKSRAVHALSCLLRRFPLAQLRFMKNGGLSIVSKLLDKNSLKLQVKLVTLMNDLIVENIQATKYEQNSALKQYELVNLQSKLLTEQNWCENLNELLLTLFSADPDDHDLLEKCLIAMHTVSENCASVYKTDILIQIMEKYKDLEENEKYGEDTNINYFSNLRRLIMDILNVKNIKTEL